MKPIKAFIESSLNGFPFRSMANIRLVDDRSKHDSVYVDKIFYEDDYYILGRVFLQPVLFKKSIFMIWDFGNQMKMILMVLNK